LCVRHGTPAADGAAWHATVWSWKRDLAGWCGHRSPRINSMRPWCPVVAIACATALHASAPGQAPASAPSNEMLVSLLLSPTERDRATCELLRRQNYSYASDPGYSHCHVNAVMVAPQQQEPSIFVVFLAEEWSAGYAKEGVPKGHFVLLASDGSLLPVFWNANVLSETGDLIRYAGDDRLALALIVPVDDGRFGGSGLPTLHIVPIERSPHSILSLIVGPSGHEVLTGGVVQPGDGRCFRYGCVGKGILEKTRTVYPWGWRETALAGQAPTIEIGPNSALRRGKPTARFRWSESKHRYEGPSGSRARGFLRFDTRFKSWPDAVLAFTGRRPR